MATMPQEMVTRMSRAHHQGQILLESSGSAMIESVDVALAAEAHRWFWQPGEVQTLLVAESRGFTTQAELAWRSKLAWLIESGSVPPDSYVRFPYCLAYAEPGICPSAAEQHAKPSLWSLWASLTGIELPLSRRGLVDRLEARVLILRRLKTLGIWMVDANLHGLAAPPGDGHLRPDLYKCWWEGYGSWLHESLGSPRIVVVGKGLHHQLSDLKIPISDWLYATPALAHPEQVELQSQTVRRVLKPSHSL